MVIVKMHSVPGFARVEVGSELKLTNLRDLYRIVEIDSDDYLHMRRIDPSNGNLEFGAPFVSHANHLNVDYKEEI